MQNDIVLDKMKELGVEPTRKNYLDFAYFGTPPKQLSAEEESMLPEQFQYQGTEDETDSGDADVQTPGNASSGLGALGSLPRA
jgi:hypothetical protein